MDCVAPDAAADLDQLESVLGMYTSDECRKRAAVKIKQAEREHNGRRANALISAAHAWLILAHGVRRLELNSKTQKR
jgi:hypothetical protein